MGKALSVAIKRPFQNFNVESRAHKVISQEKPKAAPKYEIDQIEYDRLMKENPNEFEETLKKNLELDTRLKDVYVTSNLELKREVNTDNLALRPLPSHRKTPLGDEFGVHDPETVPPGKVTLKTALKFITNHQADPRKCTVKQIAEEFTLPEEKVKSVLKYFRVFEVYIPQERDVRAKFAGPSVPRVQVLKDKFKELAPPKPPKENKEGDT